ncbi:MAG: PaaI family thioesterase [Flavimaricola sp.]|nr:PaaI family thioesterase [Flavimaricola sp.]
MKRPEPVQVVKQRRDAALQALVGGVPYIQFLGIRFDRRGDELTAILPFDDKLIGNPMIPALHGGATAAFLEVAAIIELSWAMIWDEMEHRPAAVSPAGLPPEGAKPANPALPLVRLPKTIDFTVDYLRSGLPRDAYARARVNRSGRRFASVHVEAWQDNRARLFAQATGHFLMPDTDV